VGRDPEVGSKRFEEIGGFKDSRFPIDLEVGDDLRREIIAFFVFS
jgi:hypothetical protein